jgi:hypothetical protein
MNKVLVSTLQLHTTWINKGLGYNNSRYKYKYWNVFPVQMYQISSSAELQSDSNGQLPSPTRETVRSFQLAENLTISKVEIVAKVAVYVADGLAVVVALVDLLFFLLDLPIRNKEVN